MKKGLLVLTALVAFVFALPVISEAKIEITGAALVGVQDVDFDSTNADADEDFNFNDPRVNLYINGEVSDKISLTAKFWANNDWSSENQRPAANGASAIPGAAGNTLNDAVEMLRAYVTIKDVMGSGFNAMIGTIDIPFGWEYGMRTANGDDMKNDFITNSLLDINGGAPGISVSGSFDMGQTSTPLSWEVALMDGGATTDGNPSGQLGAGNPSSGNRSNDDLAWAIRAEVGVMENLTLQASWYTNDQRKDGDQDPLNVGSTFFVNAVSHGPSATAGGNVGSLVQNVNLNGLVYTSVADGAGYDRDLWEVASKYDYGQGYVMAFWGNVQADTGTVAGAVSGKREWDYWGAQGRYNFDENSYLAVRYNTIDPDYTTAVAGQQLGEPSMWTVAAGYKLADNAMVKAEWSSFDEDGQDFGLTAGGTAASNGNQDADALTVAVGVSF